MHVEIVQGNCSVNTRQFVAQGKDRTAYDQPAFLHIPGSPYPLPFKLSLNSVTDAYAPGTYVFTPDSVRTNQYGQLEFNRFSMSLVKCHDPKAEKRVS